MPQRAAARTLQPGPLRPSADSRAHPGPRPRATRGRRGARRTSRAEARRRASPFGTRSRPRGPALRSRSGVRVRRPIPPEAGAWSVARPGRPGARGTAAHPVTDSVVSHEAKHGSGCLQERFLDRSQGKLRAHQDASATSVAAAMARPPGSDCLPVAPHKAAPAGSVADASPRPGRIQGAKPWCGQCSGSSESRPVARHFPTRGDDGREQSGRTSDSPVARRVENRPNFFPPRFFSAISQPELGDYVARSNPNEGSLVRPPWSQGTITLVRWPGRPGTWRW